MSNFKVTVIFIVLASSQALFGMQNLLEEPKTISFVSSTIYNRIKESNQVTPAQATPTNIDVRQEPGYDNMLYLDKLKALEVRFGEAGFDWRRRACVLSYELDEIDLYCRRLEADLARIETGQWACNSYNFDLKTKECLDTFSSLEKIGQAIDGLPDCCCKEGLKARFCGVIFSLGDVSLNLDQLLEDNQFSVFIDFFE